MLIQLEGRVLPGKMDSFAALVAKYFPGTRAFDGCNGITAHVAEDGASFVFVEDWDSKPQYEAYLAWREETGVLAELAAVMEGPPLIRFFTALDA
ncbi:MAG TPA: antibiotic biosynthesis monooxygenase [Pseudomonadales bacterium]|nr:antibiotic biosynthesis monooxygenase [Pseudomonadales bacterium]